MNKRLFSALLALILAMAIAGAACAKPGNQELHGTPESSTMEPTATPTEVPTQTPKPTPEPTPPFTALVPENTELDEHDFNAVRSFLEIKDENGVRNGEKLNYWYDPDDPATWFVMTISPDDKTIEFIPIAEWHSDGTLYAIQLGGVSQHRISYDFDEIVLNGMSLIGTLDLSGCTGLQSVEVNGVGISEIKLDGCTALHDLLIADATELSSISPATMLTNGEQTINLRITNCKLTELNWYLGWIFASSALSESNYTAYYYAQIDLTVEGPGSVGFETVHDGEDSYVKAIAYKDDFTDDFLGWYDAKTGKLVSEELELDIVADDEGEGSHGVAFGLDAEGTVVLEFVAKFKHWYE